MADTIAAVSTGRGISAIGIIRLSGDTAIETAERVFRPLNGRKLSELPDRLLVLGELLAEDGAVLDRCLCTVSRGPSSYTGEDTAEIQCHGSPVVLSEGLKSLFRAGARQALAGEFTRRAFLNGLLDLTQAEAVIDLIDAETAEGAKNAAGQLGGAVSRRTDRIYDALLDMTAHFQAVIDYPDEDIEDFRLREYLDTFHSSEEELKRLLSTFERGSLLRTGVPTAIIGRPNAGKSSLLNAMVGYERAIVTAREGTTRDTIEERVRIGGSVLRLTDTAGIRPTEDEAERLGVERARRAAEDASLVLAVFDGSRPVSDEDREVAERASRAEGRIAVVNKSDLPAAFDEELLAGRFDGVVHVSALTGDGIDSLAEQIGRVIGPLPQAGQGEILTNARQAEAVSRALEAITAAREAAEDGVTPDAVLTGVEEAMAALGELTGKTVRDDVVTRIFERFCVGK